MAITEFVNLEKVLVVRLKVLFLSNGRLSGTKGKVNHIKEAIQGRTPIQRKSAVGVYRLYLFER